MANCFSRDAYDCAASLSSEVDIILTHKKCLIERMRSYQPRRSMEVIMRGIEEISQKNEKILRRVGKLEDVFDKIEERYDRIEERYDRVEESRKMMNKFLFFISCLIILLLSYIINKIN